LIRKFKDLLPDKDIEDKLSISGKLIEEADSPSFNLRFTKQTAYQIIEWGKLYGFIGSGNQITEKGLLLRYIMGQAAVSAINDGSFRINPFILSDLEKLYFFYHHLELDTSIFFLIKRLCMLSTEDKIRGIEADRITCEALYDTYLFTKEMNTQYDIISSRELRDLIGGMVSELKLIDKIPILPKFKLKAPPIIKAKQKNIKRTHLSDGEAINRFEFLTDISILEKKSKSDSDEDKKEARNSWNYWVTQVLLSLSEKLPQKPYKEYCWNEFAHFSSGLIKKSSYTFTEEKNLKNIAIRVMDSYNIVRRQFGHTPLESIAIMTMIRALVDSVIIEINDVHKLFMNIKLKNLFPNIVHFAAGNEIDKMFIDIKPNFINELNKYYENC
jgi:hypothetical protein